MTTCTYTYQLNQDIINILPEDDFFFDIETTGLSKKTTILYLIGCAYRRNDQLEIIQWFNDDAVSEPDILKTFSDFTEQFRGRMYTFNGESFDIPYLNLHYEYNEIPSPLEHFVSVDLYRLLKPFQYVFGMEHGKQKDWETFLGLYREDQYNGGQLIKVYKDYLKSKDPELLELLLLHNMEDVRGMSHVLTLLSFENLVNGQFCFVDIQAYSAGELSEHVLKDDSASSYSISYISKASSKQKVPVDTPASFLKLIFKTRYSIPVSFKIDAPHGSIGVQGEQLELTLPCLEGELKHFFPDFKNYYYLPAEDTAVHKSIGCFVDNAYKKKAKAATCYVRKDGCYLAFPHTHRHYGFRIDTSDYENLFTIYRKSYQHKIRYIDFEELNFSKDPDSPYILPAMQRYFGDMIKEILISYLDGNHNT